MSRWYPRGESSEEAISKMSDEKLFKVLEEVAEDTAFVSIYLGIKEVIRRAKKRKEDYKEMWKTLKLISSCELVVPNDVVGLARSVLTQVDKLED